MRTTFLPLILCCAFAASAKKAPDFTLPNISGQNVSMSDFKGKVVVLDFWAMWCVTCWDLFPVLNEIKQRTDTSKVAVVGLSIDKKPIKDLIAFTKRAGIKYQVLHDQKAQLPLFFGLTSLPTLFIIDAKGEIVKTYTKASPKKKAEIFKAVESLINSN